VNEFHVPLTTIVNSDSRNAISIGSHSVLDHAGDMAQFPTRNYELIGDRLPVD
jgi:hypothetical protein